jgi:hypothetical protein
LSKRYGLPPDSQALPQLPTSGGRIAIQSAEEHVPGLNHEQQHQQRMLTEIKDEFLLVTHMVKDE